MAKRKDIRVTVDFTPKQLEVVKNIAIDNSMCSEDRTTGTAFTRLFRAIVAAERAK